MTKRPEEQTPDEWIKSSYNSKEKDWPEPDDKPSTDILTLYKMSERINRGEIAEDTLIAIMRTHLEQYETTRHSGQSDETDHLAIIAAACFRLDRNVLARAFAYSL